MTINSRAIAANTDPRLFGLLKSRVVLGVCAAGNTVVGVVGRLVLASVRCGKTLVSISLDVGADPKFTVPESHTLGQKIHITGTGGTTLATQMRHLMQCAGWKTSSTIFYYLPD